MTKPTNVRGGFSPDIKKLLEGHPDLLFSQQEMKDVLDLAITFDQNESPLRGEYFKDQFAEFREAVSSVDGYLGVFGTGHPFYAYKPDGGVYGIEEYRRHIGEALDMNKWDAKGAMGAWACAACHNEYRLPDLKQFCKPCEVVELKPREVFKRLPDLDFWMIVDENSSDVEREVESLVREVGFYTSDDKIHSAINSTTEVMKALNNGRYPDARLPIDLHIVERNELSEALHAVPQQLDGDRFIPIAPRSLHVDWEATDSPYNFLKDFLFSLESNDWQDEELTSALRYARLNAKEYFAQHDITEYVAHLAPKEARQLETPGIRQVLEERIRPW